MDFGYLFPVIDIFFLYIKNMFGQSPLYFNRISS